MMSHGAAFSRGRSKFNDRKGDQRTSRGIRTAFIAFTLHTAFMRNSRTSAHSREHLVPSTAMPYPTGLTRFPSKATHSSHLTKEHIYLSKSS